MHISDGVLSMPILAAGWIVTILLIIITLAWSYKTYKKDIENDTFLMQIPKIAIMTAAIFVASLIHIPVGVTSVHLIMAGVLGVILGPFAFVCVFIALFLQAVLFNFGGLLVLGVNAANMGIAAIISYFLFKFLSTKINPVISGAIAGGIGVCVTAVLLGLTLYINGTQFINYIFMELVLHAPVAVIETIVTAFVVAFLMKVKPELLCIDIENIKTKKITN
ncbi:MAG: cobalt transporter CbiM [Methanosarcinaceae archaeon]|nr:cobalt transporter CbiM [Methanosarcinaceae archaeon]